MGALTDLRTSISKIDASIIDLLAQRFQLIPKLLELKQQLNLPIFDPIRENEILGHYRDIAEQFHLDPVFISEIFSQIITKMRTEQEGVHHG